MSGGTLADFLAAGSTPQVSGSDTWGARYAAELRQVAIDAARRAPRSLQVHLGPSEIGVPCHRQVAGKLAGLAETNHVADPWPSIVGTAIHAWLADAFAADNQVRGTARWTPENRVLPIEGHSGTADLYDADYRAVVDHKGMGESTLGKLRNSGPSRQYRVQLLLYALGYLKAGYPVEKVVLAAWPRTRSSLDGLYVWSEDFTDESIALLNTVIEELQLRKDYAALITAGKIGLMDVPATPSDDVCYFCPLYRPQAAHDGGVGCPGNRGG
jgi:hypothetical protein